MDLSDGPLSCLAWPPVPGMRERPEIWAARRIECEAQARASHPAGEPDLLAVYRNMADRLGWPNHVVQAAIREEIELDSASVFAVPEIKQRINGLRASGTSPGSARRTIGGQGRRPRTLCLGRITVVTRFIIYQGDTPPSAFAACRIHYWINSGPALRLYRPGETVVL